jgi:hypothetical protein
MFYVQSWLAISLLILQIGRVVALLLVRQRCCMRGALQHRFEPGLIQSRKILPQINYIVSKPSQH